MYAIFPNGVMEASKHDNRIASPGRLHRFSSAGTFSRFMIGLMNFNKNITRKLMELASTPKSRVYEMVRRHGRRWPGLSVETVRISWQIQVLLMLSRRP